MSAGEAARVSAETKRVVVELFGAARKVAGVAEVELELALAATVRDTMRALAAIHSALSGTVIDPESCALKPHFFLNLDGRETIREYDFAPRHGARLLLMSAIVGG